MTGDQYEREHSVAPRHPAGRWLVLLTVLAVVGFGAWYLEESPSNRNLPAGGTQSAQAGTLQQPFQNEGPSSAEAAPGARPTGTSGTAEIAAAGGIDSPAVIKEIETITGTNDGHELVGRKVSLHVPVQGKANDVAFWVGEKDNRLLVVMARDRRDGSERQQGTLAEHGIAPVHGGQQADITGTIQKVPRAEQMYSWGLTREDRQELAERPIYIRADSVRTEGHGE